MFGNAAVHVVQVRHAMASGEEGIERTLHALALGQLPLQRLALLLSGRDLPGQPVALDLDALQLPPGLTQGQREGFELGRMLLGHGARLPVSGFC